MEEIPGRLDKIEGAKSVIQDQNILNMNTSTASTSQTPFCIVSMGGIQVMQIINSVRAAPGSRNNI